MSDGYVLRQYGNEVQEILDDVQQKTVYDRATSSKDGLMSATDKKKLDDEVVPETRTVNGKALSQDITLTPEDVGAYELPGNGIPKSDLTADVQASLSKADTALQSESDPVFSESPASAITDENIASWNGKSDFSGSYNDLTDKPTIPDAQVQSDWAQTNSSAKDYIKNKPSVPSVDAELSSSSTNPVQNRVINSALAGKQGTIQDLDAIRSGAAAGANAYQKPNGGIPKTDLAEAVQVSLNKADAAVQQSELTAIEGDIDAIEAKIPSAASAVNQLADKAFVNSSIATNTATFKGTYESLAELQAVTGATNNDYGFVIEHDAAGNEYYDRYKFNGTAWIFEYKIESTPFTAAQWATFQSGITSGDVAKLAALPTKAQLDALLADKQDTISDLETIRSGAALGATALQSFTETDPTVPSWAKASTKPSYTAQEVGALPSDTPLFSGDYEDLTNKPTIPSAVTESTVSGWGFTKNTGTITGITMNGTSKGTSGVVDLGTVITDISGKQDALVSGTNIKTINNESLLGSGNITISGGGGGVSVTVDTALSTASTNPVQNAVITTNLNGKADKIAEVNHGTSDTSLALTPNVLHVWDTVGSLTLTLGTGESGVMNEYMFQFDSGSTATTLSLPSSVKWITDNTIEANKTYHVSILNNLAVMGGA